MFIKIKKNCGILMENNAMESGMLIPVSSNFLLNLNQVAEISFYSLKENKQRQTLEHGPLTVPMNTRVIHMTMDYRYSSHEENRGGSRNRQINQRAYYKLFFLPESPGEYEDLRSHIEDQVCNL
ncbi:MAG: hypothetical protein ACI9W6_002940 [Motiliproteus sp.]|jgi:hypothetical protein